MAAKRRRVDWGELLDEVWGEETDDDERVIERSVQLLECYGNGEHEDVRANWRRLPAVSRPLYESRDDMKTSGVRRRQETEPCLSPSSFSPCLFSHTSTPTRETGSHVGVRNRRLELELHASQRNSWSSINFGDYHRLPLRHYTVDVIKCAIPAGCEISSLAERNSTVIVHTCAQGLNSNNTCISAKTTCKNQTYEVIDRIPSRAELNIHLAQDTTARAYKSVTANRKSISSVIERGPYSSPLLFSEPCTPALTLTCSPDVVKHSDSISENLIEEQSFPSSDDRRFPIGIQISSFTEATSESTSSTPDDKAVSLLPNFPPNASDTSITQSSFSFTCSCTSLLTTPIITPILKSTESTLPPLAISNNDSHSSTCTPLLTTPTLDSNLSTPLSGPMFNSTQSSPLTPSTLSSNHSPPLTMHTMLTFNNRHMPLTKTSQNTCSEATSVSRDSTPSMLPGIMTESNRQGRRLLLAPHSPTHTSSWKKGGKENRCSWKQRGDVAVNLDTVLVEDRRVKKQLTRRRNKSRGQKLEQLCLDLGQRSFGHVTCSVCGMVYTSGLDDDVREHSKFHRRYLTGVTFNGWKNERVVHQYFDGRIVMVLPTDPRQHLKKVQDLCRVVDAELGYAQGVKPWNTTCKIFLYVSTDKKVMGCVIAEKIEQGYRVLPSSMANCSDHLDGLSAWCCSSVSEPAQVGINRVWVSLQHRRRGVASRLLDAVRLNFHAEIVVSEQDLAFSDPTPDGKALAEQYCHSYNFLVYRWVK